MGGPTGSASNVHRNSDAAKVCGLRSQSQPQLYSEPRSPDWQRVYDEALSETDQKALTKIWAAEATLVSRLQQMHYERSNVEEAIALCDAIHILRLKRCVLRFRNELARLADLTTNHSWARFKAGFEFVGQHESSVRKGGTVRSEIFEIFARKPDGELLWLESIRGREAAQFQMQARATQKPGPYFMFSTTTFSVVARIDTSKSLHSRTFT